ncbi:partial Protein-glutamine gamma-glutamyltransferase, partial [Planctomycetaceae bacterium]
MNFTPSSSLYRTITRVLGIALSVTGVLFHRRGLSDWREPTFIITCVALQELFLVLPVLRRFRSFLLAFYLMLPAIFVLVSLDRIEPHRGDAIALALQTPLPLLLLPIQLMVLYTREAPRLSSLVLVLTLFFVVAGLRRQVDDLVWPWLLVIGTLAMFYMAFSYPARVQLNMFPPNEGRSLAPLVSNPGGLVRGSFFGLVWMAVSMALVITVALFLVVPRVRLGQSSPENNSMDTAQSPGRGTGRGGGGTQQPPRRDLSSVSALSDSVELGDFGEIKQSGLKALEIKPMSPETPRTSAPPIYLRAYTYGVFNGEAWAALPTATTDARRLPATQERRRVLPNARASKPVWRQKSYVVLVFDGGTGRKGDLPVSAEPTALLDFAGDATWDARSGVIRAPSISRGSEYGFECREFNYDYIALEELVAGTQPLAPPGEGAARSIVAPTRSYWLLPEGLVNKLAGLPLIKEVTERAKSRSAGGTPMYSPVAAARWLVSYFRNESRTTGTKFRYSLVERPEPGADCIYRFLTTQRYGHCEYYASAMCVVLRAAGVPCRLAAGFHASRFNKERNVYEVTAADAHAWVEVYVRDYGWIPFDPTPAADDMGEQPTPEPEPTEPEPTPEATEPPKTGEPEPTAEEEQAARDPVVHFGPDAQQELLN